MYTVLFKDNLWDVTCFAHIFQCCVQVENLYKCLEREYKRNGEQPLSLFELAFNPHSFAQTIENLFHLSFLVKDGRAGLVSGAPGDGGGGGDDDDDGIMRVAWLPPNEKGARQHNQTQAEEEQRSALAFTLDMGIWRAICERYHLRECLVPDRGYHESDNEDEEHSAPEDASDDRDEDEEMAEEQEEEEEDGQDEEEQVVRNAAVSQVNASLRVKTEPMSQ